MNQLHPLVYRLRRAALHAVERLGPAGLLGAALLVLAAVAGLAGLQTHRGAAGLHERADALQEQLQVLEATGATRRVSNPGERLARFQNWFPSDTTIPQDLRRIFAAAEANHVVLLRGEYSLTNVDGSPTLEKLDVVLPVHEHYGPVRGFFSAVLNELPHASLKDLRVERPQSGTEELESRVHFTLYYRKGAA